MRQMKTQKWTGKLLTVVCLVLVLFPVFFIFLHSFAAGEEIEFFPQMLTLQNWKKVLLWQPGYLVKFWISLGGAGMIVVGQLVVSLFGAAAFSKYRFPGSGICYFLLIVLMMMPVQVTLVPNYIVLNLFHLNGGWAALILPAVFLPFGTVFLTQIMRTIPDEILESARLDGAGTGRLLGCVLFPMVKGGAACLAILNFADAWNMVEQPMIFLERPEQYPLSVFLAVTHGESAGSAFACGVLVLLPVLLLYLYYKEELLTGLAYSGVK